jgi:hypothetical protein
MRIILIALCILLYGCDAQKQCQKHAEKAIKGGCLKTDSFRVVEYDTIPPVIIEGSRPIHVVRRVMDSLRFIDTCYTEDRINTVLKHIDSDTSTEANPLYTLKKWHENGDCKHILYFPKRIDSTVNNHSGIKYENDCPECPKQQKPWKEWIVIFALIVFLAVALWKGH